MVVVLLNNFQTALTTTAASRLVEQQNVIFLEAKTEIPSFKEL
jgi:hypothetical protein